jgi:hypothetical protein
MHRPPLRSAFSSKEQTRDAIKASHEACQFGYDAIEEMRADHAAILKRIAASSAAIEEAQEALKKADTLRLDIYSWVKNDAC